MDRVLHDLPKGIVQSDTGYKMKLGLQINHLRFCYYFLLIPAMFQAYIRDIILSLFPFLKPDHGDNTLVPAHSTDEELRRRY